MGAAEAGGGTHGFVNDSEDLISTVVEMLDASLSPCVDDFKIEGPDFKDVVEAITPDPELMGSILRN